MRYKRIRIQIGSSILFSISCFSNIAISKAEAAIRGVSPACQMCIVVFMSTHKINASLGIFFKHV